MENIPTGKQQVSVDHMNKEQVNILLRCGTSGVMCLLKMGQNWDWKT